MLRRLLPWEYAVRNLFRRPWRSAITLAAMTTVILLIYALVGFIRGLERSLEVSGDPDVALVYSLSAEESIENSSIPARTAALLEASLDGIQQRYGSPQVSPELYLGTRIARGGVEEGSMGLVRGVTAKAAMVRRSVRIVEGRWPNAGELMVGRLAATKLGFDTDDLSIGGTLKLEGKTWPIVGRFEANESSFESEVWCRLADLQQCLKRQDLSVVALLLRDRSAMTNVQLFCKERLDLELQAISEADYFASLQQFYRPIRLLAWSIVGLVASSGIFAAFNTMYGAAMGRVREVAALQAIGYRRRSILVSFAQESLLLASAASLIAGVIAILWFNGVAVRFTMGAFALRIDSEAVLVGTSVGLVLGLLGAIPAAIRALRMPVVESLKAV